MQIALSESQAGNESDEYLIELIGLKADFPEEAMAAYGKIYTRYWDIMFAIALRVTRDEDTAADLLSDTFNMIYNKASTFKAGKLKNQDNIRLSIQKWMTTIMQHIFYDHFLDDEYKNPLQEDRLNESYIIDKKSVSKYLDNDYDDFVEKLQVSEQDNVADTLPCENAEDSENIVKIKDYLKKLPERDRDIILMLYDHYIPGKYTPAAILNILVEKWGTTRENIRKIMEKFRRSIKEDLQSKIFIRK